MPGCCSAKILRTSDVHGVGARIQGGLGRLRVCKANSSGLDVEECASRFRPTPKLPEAKGVVESYAYPLGSLRLSQAFRKI